MRRYLPFLLFACIIFTFLPWLGDTLFNTKGEPREAIVALSMIQSGDYILPVSCGGDIPYKPPFLAWLIVACSWLTGGVTEFSSRLPSAIATIAMAAGIYRYVRRRSAECGNSMLLAALTAAVTVTAFEVFRAATACRVDMVLTACIVGSILMLERRRETDGKPQVSVTAIILMTCAVLTKGPVGMLLPCLITGIYFLLRGDSFFRSLWVLALSGILSLAGYAAWFAAALHTGGDAFADLMWEENIGRMTGTMSYESHVNPAYYNIITIIAGMAPYTLVALLSLAAVKYARPQWSKIKAGFRRLTPVELLSLTAIAVTLIFYSIPASKRSVYLLPLYPFLSYFVARMMIWLADRKSRCLTAYACIIGALSIIAPIALVVINGADVNPLIARMKPDTAAMLAELHSCTISFAGWLCIVMSLLAGATLFGTIRRADFPRMLIYTIAATFTIYWTLSSTAMPAILNSKSDMRLVRVINRYATPDETIYSFIDTPMLRYYTAGFYLNDRVVPIQGRNPSYGYILVGENDLEKLMLEYGDRYRFRTVHKSPFKSSDTRRPTLILQFSRR